MFGDTIGGCLKRSGLNIEWSLSGICLLQYEDEMILTFNLYLVLVSSISFHSTNITIDIGHSGTRSCLVINVIHIL